MMIIFFQSFGFDVRFLLATQIIGSEDRRRTLTPLALRERYSALNEPAMGKRISLKQFLYVYLIEILVILKKNDSVW